MGGFIRFSFILCFLIGCALPDGDCPQKALQCKLTNESSVLQYSTDVRLMVGIKEIGALGNGMLVHSWFWNNNAKKLGPMYNDPNFGGVIDFKSPTAVGLLTSEVKKMYPMAVVVRPDGFEQINEKVLMQKDAFIKSLIEARKIEGSNSCTRVIDTNYRFCF
jgi:hypothetical protein